MNTEEVDLFFLEFIKLGTKRNMSISRLLTALVGSAGVFLPFFHAGSVSGLVCL